ncbi:MAG: DUF262 domain-containing protein, partial [Pseudobacter sp.]|uniref:DUF262 domain-containing protein n=1 Tax=Pseudobacter sp. TaxID=2045420 RepID=UPI003F81E140
MKTDSYSLIELFEYRNLEQFVVPEIQRDYVWQPDDITSLLDYFHEGFSGSKEDKPYLGFIYAYNHSDFLYKYFLIDGQQRITSLYLLLLACYHKAGKKTPDYLCLEGMPKLDYKVRQSSHDFIQKLTSHCHENPGKEFSIRDQVWYHKEYEYDQSIQNIANNFEEIHHWLHKHLQEPVKFARFIEHEVVVSYFDIEEVRQGEELYIYMNSRGRQLEVNETLKAKFLAKTEDKDFGGTKWEHWQDFFWKHKGNEKDADPGFNDFLRMVQILWMSQNAETNEKISAFSSGKTERDAYFEKLPQTIEELEVFYEAYVWMVNSEAIRNFFREQDKNENYITNPPTVFEKRQAFYLRVLPVLAFLSVSKCRNEDLVIRFIRFFNNAARKRNIGKDIGNQLPVSIKLMLEYGKTQTDHYDVCDLLNYTKGRTTLIDQEEQIKLQIYKNPSIPRTEAEQIFWEAEDHRLLEGEISC